MAFDEGRHKGKSRFDMIMVIRSLEEALATSEREKKVLITILDSKILDNNKDKP